MRAESLQLRVTRRLRAWVSQNPTGSQLPSVRALMADWDVSAATIRAAQAVLAAEGLIAVRHGSGAYVADRAAGRHLAVVTELDLLHPRVGEFHRQAVRAVLAGLEAQGYATELYLGRTAPGQLHDVPSNHRFWADVVGGRVAGVVFHCVPETDTWDRRVRGLSIPAVGALTGTEAPDHQLAMIPQAVALLRARGCQRLALLAWHPHADTVFLQAAEDQGLAVCTDWLRDDLEPGLPGAGWEEFREIWTAARQKPDGLIVLDQELYEDAATAIMELGIRVPDHLQVATHAVRGTLLRADLPATRLEADPAPHAAWLVAALAAKLTGRDLPAHVPPPPAAVVEHLPAPVRAAAISATVPSAKTASLRSY